MRSACRPGQARHRAGAGRGAGVLVNVETARELPVLASASQRLGLPARVAIRVNPGLRTQGLGHAHERRPKQFGIDARRCPRCWPRSDNWPARAQFEGFHLFAGSQNLKPEAICEAQQRATNWPCAWPSAPAPVKFLNLGGGFGIPISRANHGWIWRPSGPTWPPCRRVLGADLPGAKLGDRAGPLPWARPAST